MPNGRRVVRETGRVASAWAFSIVGHVAGFGLAGLLVAATMNGPRPVSAIAPAAPPPDTTSVELELPAVIDGSQLVDPPAADVKPLPAPRGGGEATPRLDDGKPGRGGQGTSETAAVNLADRDDGVLLSPEMMSRLDRNQLQRVLASKRRASREDWRASRDPMELTFIAEGRRDVDPTRREHRRPSDADPSAGLRARGAVAREGTSLGADRLLPGVGERAQLAGVPIDGAASPSAGRGVRDGAPGDDHRDAALVARARPMVNEGTPSVAADQRDRPTDNVDSEQEVATRMQSILHASTAGGVTGVGNGGQGGPSTPAASGGAAGQGSRATALGTGPGPGVDNDPRDKRRNEYMRAVVTKLAPYTQWRRLMSVEAAVEGVQGVVIVTFTILADGSVTAVTLTRSSGVPELDANFRAAITKAAPFPPLPPELGTSFRWAFPLDLRNPAVRPKDPSRTGVL